MKTVGIISDLKYSKHMQFKNYYYALQSLYGAVRIINKVDDLKGIQILFIGDDHYTVHRDVFTKDKFASYCNLHKIKVVVFTPEKILNTIFPWNESNNEFLNNFNHLYHYTYDTDDCKLLGTKLHRLCMSKTYKDVFPVDIESRLNRIVFIGSLDCPYDKKNTSYQKRKELVESIQNTLPLDIFPASNRTWQEYMNIMSHYRFVLSPLGNGSALVTRFYEALLLKTIPIQQVAGDILSYYDIESKFEDCLYFENSDQIQGLVKSCELQSSTSEIWLEDYLATLLREDGLL